MADPDLPGTQKAREGHVAVAAQEAGTETEASRITISGPAEKSVGLLFWSVRIHVSRSDSCKGLHKISKGTSCLTDQSSLS